MCLITLCSSGWMCWRAVLQGIYSAVGRGIDILLNRIYEERLRNRRQNGGDVGMLQMEVIVANSCAGREHLLQSVVLANDL